MAKFEIAEALRSRLVVILILGYGGGALIASALFLQVLHSGQEAAREMLATQLQTDPASLPLDLVHDQAMPWLVQLVDDEATRQRLLRMDPLSIFFAFITLESVAMLVMLMASKSIARDVGSGAVRFVLVRVDRLTWTLGKVLGQALLLGFGLVLAAAVTALTGAWVEGTFEPTRLAWLASGAVCAWFFGMAYLGIFSGISMVSRSPMRARAGALFVWMLLGVGHFVADSDWLAQQAPTLSASVWLFPTHYQPWLWSGSFSRLAAAAALLLVLGGSGFALGYAAFERRDA